MALPEPPGDKGGGILDALTLAAPNGVKDIQSTLLVDEGVQVLDLPARACPSSGPAAVLWLAERSGLPPHVCCFVLLVINLLGYYLSTRHQ